MVQEIEIERDSACRGIQISTDPDKAVAYLHAMGSHGNHIPLSSILIPDNVMSYLEEYFTKVINGTEHRFWKVK
jgi:hypothetical protein